VVLDLVLIVVGGHGYIPPLRVSCGNDVVLVRVRISGPAVLLLLLSLPLLPLICVIFRLVLGIVVFP
jgi:hypothetical protein